MKRNYLLLLICIFFIAACSDDKEVNTGTKETNAKNSTVNNETASQKEGPELIVPDFNDPAVKQYYTGYSAYLTKVAASIRNKDEEGTMKLFREEGNQWDAEKGKMEKKATSTPEEEQKFNGWLIQSLAYVKEIVQSPYYTKYNEEYYKKVKEDFKKKGN